MWCNGALTEECRHRMYNLLDPCARQFHPKEPVVRLDEQATDQEFAPSFANPTWLASETASTELTPATCSVTGSNVASSGRLPGRMHTLKYPGIKFRN